MTCDECGCTVPAIQAAQTTRDEQIDAPSAHGPTRTRTVIVNLCPRCARRRNNTPRFLVLSFLAVLLILTLFRLAVWLLG